MFCIVPKSDCKNRILFLVMNLGRLNCAREAECKAPIKHSLDIWHIAKNLVKKIAKVVLFVMYCSFLLCLRCFVRSDLDNNKYNTE